MSSDMRYCRECLARQQEIDRLLEENARLKERLRRQERTAREEPFGASTPSSKKLVKASTPQEGRAKCGGAVPGHKGHGRASVPREAAERVERLAAPCACPECGGVLEVRGERERTVHDCAPVKKTTHVCVQERLWCTHCRKSIHTKVPGVLPRSSISNNLLAQVFKWHYLEGITLGCIRRQFKLGEGTLCGRLHALAQIFEPAHRKLREHYRASAVKHADETGWRNDGANGYAWGFFAPGISLFECRNTRSGRIAAEVFGQDSAHVGTLVVDRYPAYNVFKGNIQYCYEHLKRDTLKVAEDNPGEAECAAFSEALSALLIEAMRLRSVEKDPARYREKAVQLRRQIEEVVKAPARHPSVQRIQNIFRENAQRLYHWVEAPCIPAENNLAERGLRPLVIARKISFGSQSEKGLRTRSILMSIAHTLAARTGDVEGGVCKVLDALVANPNLDVAQYLFGEDGLAKPPAVPAAPCR